MFEAFCELFDVDMAAGNWGMLVETLRLSVALMRSGMQQARWKSTPQRKLFHEDARLGITLDRRRVQGNMECDEPGVGDTKEPALQRRLLWPRCWS